MASPRMTVEDVSKDLRARGMPMSKGMVCRSIKAGVFPFASIINVGKTGRNTFLILRKDYENWADQYIPKEETQ